jgi:hypothetical protein
LLLVFLLVQSRWLCVVGWLISQVPAVSRRLHVPALYGGMCAADSTSTLKRSLRPLIATESVLSTRAYKEPIKLPRRGVRGPSVDVWGLSGDACKR